MNLTLRNLSLNGTLFHFKLPNFCPCCNTKMYPKILSHNSENQENEQCGLIFQCPSCHEIFFAKYSYSDDGLVFKYPVVYPSPQATLNLPTQIKEFYPEFYEIYRQSAEAEEYKLDKICGMGYRKALEFLVKHYLFDKFPDKKEAIQKEYLGKSIARIPYPNIQALAHAATWIGNDETHIEKKHQTYGVEDMKAFMTALSHLILAEKTTEDAVSLISK